MHCRWFDRQARPQMLASRIGADVRLPRPGHHACAAIKISCKVLICYDYSMLIHTNLHVGDEIRIVAPSDSWKNEKADIYTNAEERLTQAGYQVTFGDNIKSHDYLDTAFAQLRADDLNSAYRDDNVKAIMALHGGFFANEVLPLLDWEMIQAHPKPFIGYSDNTVLVNALCAKTGQTNYLGPNFGTLGYQHAWQYGFDNLLQILTTGGPVLLKPSLEWYENDLRHISAPCNVIQIGTAQARLLGGKSQSFYLLQGTEFQPSFDEDFVLALEADELAAEYTLHELTRSLESVLQLSEARKHLQGLLIGRFETNSQVDDIALAKIIKTKNVGNIPVVSNLDFGHTMPIATLPIGGMVKIDAQIDQTAIEFTNGRVR